MHACCLYTRAVGVAAARHMDGAKTWLSKTKLASPSTFAAGTSQPLKVTGQVDDARMPSLSSLGPMVMPPNAVFGALIF